MKKRVTLRRPTTTTLDVVPMLPPGVAPVAARRAASQKDSARIAMIEQLRRDGVDAASATWQVVGLHPALRYVSFKDEPRPSDHRLLQKLAALICRCYPEAIERGRQAALTTFAGAAQDSAQLVAGLATGTRKIKNPKAEQVRLNAGRTTLEALGVGGKAAPQVQVNVAVGTLAQKIRDAQTARTEP
jgi:hypothetical protein